MSLTLFFDRSVGTRIPRALKFIGPPVEIVFHDDIFHKAAPDDKWLPEVGAKNWIVVGQDCKYHCRPNELDALKRYEIGCFYLAGGSDPRWKTFCLLVRAFDRLIEKAATTPRPFVYRVQKNSRLVMVTLP